MMIVGLLALVLWQGGRTFCRCRSVEVTTLSGNTYLEKVHDSETFRPKAMLGALPEDKRAEAQAIIDKNEGNSFRALLRTGNFEQTGTHFTWINDFKLQGRSSVVGPCPRAGSSGDDLRRSKGVSRGR